MREEGCGLWNVAKSWMIQPLSSSLLLTKTSHCSRPHRSMLVGEGVPLPPFSDHLHRGPYSRLLQSCCPQLMTMPLSSSFSALPQHWATQQLWFQGSPVMSYTLLCQHNKINSCCFHCIVSIFIHRSKKEKKTKTKWGRYCSRKCSEPKERQNCL